MRAISALDRISDILENNVSAADHNRETQQLGRRKEIPYRGAEPAITPTSSPRMASSRTNMNESSP